MSLAEKQATFALNVAKLIQHIFESGYKCTLGEAFRTFEQAKIYAAEGKGILNSYHTKRLALDINLFDSSGNFLDKSEDHRIFGEYWETLDKDNRWGGRFSKPDGNHYEMKPGPVFGSIKTKQ